VKDKQNYPPIIAFTGYSLEKVFKGVKCLQILTINSTHQTLERLRFISKSRKEGNDGGRDIDVNDSLNEPKNCLRCQ
jgi:hypothetical protein